MQQLANLFHQGGQRMTERRWRPLPSLRRGLKRVWLRRLDRVRGEPTISAELSVGERLDLAMMLMAEGLTQLEKRAREEARGRCADPEAIDWLLRRFAKLDHWWVKAKRR